MINKVLELLRDEIHDYLKLKPELNVGNQQTISLSNIVDPDGKIEIPADSLGMTLVNIEEEKVMKSQVASFKKNNTVSYFNPDIKLNLYIMITANFGDYSTALKFLSYVISFFQSKFVFDHQNSPKLDKSIEKLIAELYTLTFEQENYLWGAIGSKLLPAVMYKIRMVVVQEELTKSDAPPIQIIGLTEKSIDPV
jgi:hypothetical protein